jgi:excisionase family DNA binding protein
MSDPVCIFKGDVMEKVLLTPEQAADALSIGRTKVYELINRGLLESVRIGASRRIPADALAACVARLRAETI